MHGSKAATGGGCARCVEATGLAPLSDPQPAQPAACSGCRCGTASALLGPQAVAAGAATMRRFIQGPDRVHDQFHQEIAS
jgi:hypothetical protein